MRARFLFPVIALLALVLSACGGDLVRSLPGVELTSITPGELSVDAGSLMITGSNFFESSSIGSMRVEACGVTATASIVEPITQAVLLPPAGKLVVQAGDRLSAELPSDGRTPGVSDVRVTRPDGSSAVLEDAINCVVADDPDDETEDPDEKEPVDPTLGRLSITLSPDVPLPITISGPEGYSETVTGAATLTGLEPGEYTLTATDDTLTFEQEHAGVTYAYRAWWGPRDAPTVIEVEADEEAEAQIALLTAPGTINRSATGARADHGLEEIFLGFERLQADGSWAPADLRDFPAVETGVYRAISEAELDYFGCVGARCYREDYHLVDDGGIVSVSSIGTSAPAAFNVTYHLEPATLKVESTGLPAGLTQDYYVERHHDGYYGPQLDNVTVLDPGVYYLRMLDVNGSIDAEHPDDGTVPIAVFYRAGTANFSLSSGDEHAIPVTYGLVDGLLRVNITGYLGDVDAIGNVRFRKVGDAAWTTVTEQGLKLFWVDPGIYEVESSDVPAAGEHDGYYRRSYPTDRYFQVDSYGLDGAANHVTISVEYREN